MIAIKDRWATILWESLLTFIKEAIIVLNNINTMDFSESEVSAIVFCGFMSESLASQSVYLIDSLLYLSGL